MEGVQSPPGPVSRGPEDAARKEALRKKGAEYFEQILARAGEGRETSAHSSQQPGSSSSRKAGERIGGSTTRIINTRSLDVERLDPDLETVGLVLEGMRLYVLAALFVLSSAASLAFIQASLQALQVAGVQAFLHLLPTVAALWVVVDVGPLTLRTLQGSAIAAVIYGIQTLCLFGALVDGSAFLAVSWTLLLPPLIGGALDWALLSSPLPILAVLGVVLGSGAGVVVVAVRAWPALTSLAYLLGWAGAEAGWQLWECVRQQPDTLTAGLRPEVAGKLQELAALQEEVGPAAHEFLRVALPAVPLLLLGFLMGEGPTLLDHELSVPAVTMMLLSAIAWAVATTTGLLLQEAILSQRRRIALRLLAALGTLLVTGMVNGWGPPAPVAAAGLAVVGGSAAQFFRYKH